MGRKSTEIFQIPDGLIWRRVELRNFVEVVMINTLTYKLKNAINRIRIKIHKYIYDFDILFDIQKDKELHLKYAFLIAACTIPLIGYMYCAALIAVVAIGKEIYDYFFGGCVELQDVAYTCLGGAIGMYIGEFIKELIIFAIYW